MSDELRKEVDDCQKLLIDIYKRQNSVVDRASVAYVQTVLTRVRRALSAKAESVPKPE